MDVFLIALFIAVFIGIGLVLYAIYALANEKKENNNLSYLELDNTIKAIDASVQEADDAIEQLDKLAKSIFDELEGKYQELLFLYTLIDEKKADVKKAFYKEGSPPDTRRSEIKRDTVKNPKLDKINELKMNGLSITEIAQKLNMGQGEVKLIMEMGKAR